MSDPRDPSHPGYQRELGYAPCRNEDCDREQVHCEHVVEPRLSGRPPKTCPLCLAKLAPMDEGVMRCPCGWRRGPSGTDGNEEEEEDKEEDAGSDDDDEVVPLDEDDDEEDEVDDILYGRDPHNLFDTTDEPDEDDEDA